VGDIAVWFSYVGGCFSRSDPTCGPFLGFISLFSAAGGGLALLWIAYAGVCVHLAREARERREGRGNQGQAPERADAATAVNPRSTGWMAGA
jgi:hypothetical protein